MIFTHHLRRTDSNTLAVLSLLLIGAMLRLSHPATAALTAQEVMDNVLQVYEEIDDYATVVHTYAAESLEASGSLFEQQAAYLSSSVLSSTYFTGNRGNTPFRISARHPAASSALNCSAPWNASGRWNCSCRLPGNRFAGRSVTFLKSLMPKSRKRRGVTCYPSPRNWNVVQLTYFLNTIEFVRTQFHSSVLAQSVRISRLVQSHASA